MSKRAQGQIGWIDVRRLLWGAAVALGLMALVVSGAAAEGSCPNEALRSELRSGQLPDCRAYELVSPIYKEGAFIDSAFAVSQDGSRFIAGSLGIFGGAEEGEPLGHGNVLGVAYEFSRGRSGWTVASLAPPASKYSDMGMVDAAADLNGSLWETRLVSAGAARRCVGPLCRAIARFFHKDRARVPQSTSRRRQELLRLSRRVGGFVSRALFN